MSVKLNFKWMITLLLPFVMVSCKKEAEKKPDTTTEKTKSQLLSSVTWKYSEYFINYDQSNTILAYNIYKANNLYDLSKSRLNYYIDNTYEETLETGAKVIGTWRFIENETKIELNLNQKIITIRLLYLDSNNFQWMNSNGDVFGRMIPV